tara:strand:- start:224 stop:418 length:195 start_codon:yes stop_codon:yes gene_type:complete
MACKKSELVSAVNSYSVARTTGDANLTNLSGTILQNLIDTLEFAEEEEKNESDTEISETEVVSD